MRGSVQEVSADEAAQCYPNDPFSDRNLKFAGQTTRDLLGGRLPVALTPEPRNPGTKAVSLVSLKIVDECFLVQLPDHEVTLACLRQLGFGF